MQTEISCSMIFTGKNDRTVFDEKGLRELANSIHDIGLQQPIVVRPVNGGFELVAGERRYRACLLLGKKKIPATISEVDEKTASLAMLAENTGRKSLDPMDEANAYQKRIDQFNLTIEEIAQAVSTSTIHIRNRLKLLKLIPELQKLVRGTNIQLGYAQIIADGNLTSAYQMLAFTKLRDNPKATPGWFRGIIGELQAQQNQGVLFNGPLFGDAEPQDQKVLAPDPPHPATTIPPKRGKSIKTIIRNQMEFWEDAAEQWGAMGKPFKKQECLAAALAIGQLVYG
jgi:ParB/RepB/Spo0J family partition protein